MFQKTTESFKQAPKNRSVDSFPAPCCVFSLWIKNLLARSLRLTQQTTAYLLSQVKNTEGKLSMRCKLFLADNPGLP